MHPELLGIDDRIWLIVSLAFTLLFHLLNRKPRADVDAAVIPLKVPERRYGYSARELGEFRTAALHAPAINGQSPLDLYRKRVLPVDVGFAVALALASYCLWQIAVPTMGANGLVNWISTMGWALSFLYGAFDFGEDASLFFLLKRDPTYSGTVTFASLCTMGKMITITGSLFGLAIFLAPGADGLDHREARSRACSEPVIVAQRIASLEDRRTGRLSTDCRSVQLDLRVFRRVGRRESHVGARARLAVRRLQ